MQVINIIKRGLLIIMAAVSIDRAALASENQKLETVYYNDPRLREKAASINPEDITTERIQRLVQDMKEKMEKDDHCVGLAHNQVRYPNEKTPPCTIFVVRDILSVDSVNKKVVLSDSIVFINPEITHRSRETITSEKEGCVSIPGIFLDIERAKSITIRALNESGTPFEQTVEDNSRYDISAKNRQHEFDHLQGVLIIDKVTLTDDTKEKLAQISNPQKANHE